MAECFLKAPALLTIGADHEDNSRFYRVRQEALDIVFNELSGKSGNELKLMVVLMGTLGDGSFRVSEQWALDRTGMDHSAYNRARKALVARGWLRHEAGESITIDYDTIFRRRTAQKC